MHGHEPIACSRARHRALPCFPSRNALKLPKAARPGCCTPRRIDDATCGYRHRWTGRTWLVSPCQVSAAVDVQGLTRDVTSAGAGQPDDGAGYFVGSAASPEQGFVIAVMRRL